MQRLTLCALLVVTTVQIDPEERLAAIVFAQHFPCNQPSFFSKFTTGYFQALK